MIKLPTKPISALTIADLRRFAVWEFVTIAESTEVYVRPVNRNRVNHTQGRVFGTQVTSANGTAIWALLGNVDTERPMLSQHFLTLSVLHNKHWFTLARYHDIDAKKRSPQQLAKFLGLTIGDIFPIAYDLRSLCRGDSPVLVGKIEKDVRDKLTRAQIIELARGANVK